MLLESNVLCLMLMFAITVLIRQSNGETFTYKEDECKIHSRVYIDDYEILSNDAESGLECTIISLYRNCEHVLFRRDTKTCVCTYTYDADPPSKKDMTLINSMKSGLEDNVQPTRYIHMNKNPVVKPCKYSDYTWIPELLKCIKIISTAMTHLKAGRLCAFYKGQLIVSPTRNVTRALYSHLVCKGITSEFWIGLDGNPSKGTFSWVDNTPLTYTDWGSGEPSMTSEEYCVRIQYDEEYRWWDKECTVSYNVICEEKYIGLSADD